jgi:hypothetical protein
MDGRLKRAKTGREQMQQSVSRSWTYSMTSSPKYSRVRATDVTEYPAL